MELFSLIVGFVAGGALIWFCREPVTIWYKGAEDYVGALNDKVKKLTGKS